MTLILALQTADDKIVMAADGMNLTMGLGLGAVSDNDQFSYPSEKLYPVKRTNWTLAFSAFGGIDSFHKQLETEVELGARDPFDPHIEIGGPAYLDALIRISRNAGNLAGQQIPLAPTMLAGFNIGGKPQILAALLPQPGFIIAPSVFPMGAQEGTANWIMRTLGGMCSNVDDIKRLAYFTIWQISKYDVRVGKLESGYPISLCVMAADAPTQYEHLSTPEPWMKTWEETLQTCFVRTVQAKENKDP